MPLHQTQKQKGLFHTMTLDELFTTLDTIITSDTLRRDPDLKRDFSKKRTSLLRAICVDFEISHGQIPALQGENKGLGNQANAEAEALVNWAREHRII